MASLEGLKVLAVYEAGWTACQSSNGDTFFFNLQTDEVSTNPPPGALMAAHNIDPPVLSGEVAVDVQAAESPAQMLEKPASILQEWTRQPAQMFEKPANILQQLGDWTRQPEQILEKPAGILQELGDWTRQPEQLLEKPASILQELGDWMICEDAQGEFYWHVPTNQSYEQPPQELLVLHQQRNQEIRQQELRELWIAKQQQLRAERERSGVHSNSELPCSAQLPCQPRAACQAALRTQVGGATCNYGQLPAYR